MLIQVTLKGCCGENWATVEATEEQLKLLRLLSDMFGTEKGCSPGMTVELFPVDDQGRPLPLPDVRS